jgi:flap endonuclease-1
LAKRFERRDEAKEGEEEAKEVGEWPIVAARSARSVHSNVHVGTVEEIDKFSRRQVRVTKEHNAECRKLLELMGIPVVEVRLHFSLSFEN